MSETIPCPLCSREFSIEVIQEHAEGCNGEEETRGELGDEKLPSETYSQYYARKAKKLELKPPTEPEIPEYLKHNPFVLYCPYDLTCGWMEACNFPRHAQTRHSTNNQSLSCPVCEILGDTNGPEKDLLKHLQSVHSDLQPHEPEAPPNAYNPIGEIFEEYILKVDMKEKECTTCFEPFLKGELVISTDCLCMYHNSCTRSWFDEKKRCPIHGSGITQTPG